MRTLIVVKVFNTYSLDVTKGRALGAFNPVNATIGLQLVQRPDLLFRPTWFIFLNHQLFSLYFHRYRGQHFRHGQGRQ